MSMAIKDLSILALVMMLAACEYESVGYYPDAEITIGKEVVTADDAAPSTSESDAGPDDDASTVAGDEAPLLTGPGCTQDDECASETCLTTDLLASLGATGIDIPGGLCSKLLCEGDSDCGPRATCIDGAPFGASGFQVCLPTCDGLMDCRWQEAWGCIAPLADQPELSVCLPDNIIVAVECEEAGTCEEDSP